MQPHCMNECKIKILVIKDEREGMYRPQPIIIREIIVMLKRL